VSLYHQTWQRARSALANYLYEAYGTDGCSQEGEDPCWMETARLKATQLHPDVLTAEEKKEEKKEEAYEKKFAAQRERAEGRAAALALVAAARNRKKRRLTQAMSDGDDEVAFEGQMATLRVDSTAGLPTPEPEPTENIDTTHPQQTALTTLVIRSKPLTSTLKPSTTTDTITLTTLSIRPKPPPTIPNPPATTDTNPFNPNLDAISISPTHPPHNNTVRTATIHPTATVQDTPVPYSHPHRAETEYRHMAYYNRTCGSYEPKQWATDDTPTSGNKGKKRAREEDEDGDESGDWEYKGTVFTTEEVVGLGKSKQLRAKRGSGCGCGCGCGSMHQSRVLE
jgi:hypothetical protein